MTSVAITALKEKLESIDHIIAGATETREKAKGAYDDACGRLTKAREDRIILTATIKMLEEGEATDA